MRDEMANTSYCLQPPGSDTGGELRALAIGDFLGVLSLYAIGSEELLKLIIDVKKFRLPRIIDCLLLRNYSQHFPCHDLMLIYLHIPGCKYLSI